MPRISSHIHHLRYRVLEGLLREKRLLEVELDLIIELHSHQILSSSDQNLLSEQIQDFKNLIAITKKEIKRVRTRISYLSCA